MNLREIIENATPGPWEVYRPTDDMADVLSSHDGYHDLVAFDENAGACSLADARFIAYFDPTHIALMEAAINSTLCESFPDCTDCYVDGDCADFNLLRYRKERGLE